VVRVSATQYCDGAIDETGDDGPAIHIDVCRDWGISTKHAREVAAAIVAAAEEADRLMSDSVGTDEADREQDDDMTADDARCPRCGLLLNGTPASSRITDERDIDICGLCASEEATFVMRYPDTPLPPITERVPLD
jgi:hypothetical protein